MELRHLRYFVAVADELHFARAAQRPFISQPALSQQIRNLEAELGLKLLERDRRRVRLTTERAAFLAEARAVVQQADHAAAVARALAEGATGHLRLSYVVTVPGGLAERVVREYQRRYPGVAITAEPGRTWQNVERLRSGDLDVAFLHTPFDDGDGLGWAEIAAQPLVVALPGHRPLSRRRRIRREQTVGLPLVFFPRHQSPGVSDRGLAQVYGGRPPDIGSLAQADRPLLESMFVDFLEARRRPLKDGSGARRSPVAVAKALHLLAPSFLPIWDGAIAQAYGCDYTDQQADAYWQFREITQTIVAALVPFVAPASAKTLLKMIDEYNYAKYSKGWL